MSRRALLTLVLFFATAVAGCDQGSPSPSSPPASGSGDTITGRERIGWTQSFNGSGDASIFQYAAYVDGNRRVLENVTCSAAGDGLDCSAPLPSLSAGRHTMELATFFMGSDGATIEGPRSAPLQVLIAGVVTGSPAGSPVSGGSLVASDGQKLDADVIADGLVDPADVAIDPRGRAFVVERRGTMRILSSGSTAAGRTRTEPLFGSRDEGSQALSLALADDFPASRLVYTLAARPSDRGSRFFVTRYRELSGTLGQAAVIYTQELPGVEPRGALRFGPDGAMYIAASATAKSPGLILRLQADGRVPADNPGSSPVYARVESIPAGLAWQPADHTLWTAQTGDATDRLTVLRRMRAAGAPPNDPGSVATVAASDLPPGTRASGLAIVTAETSPFYGSVIVASAGLADLLVLTSRERDPSSDTTRLLQGRFGAIGGVSAAPAGDLYFFTANNQAIGPGRDVLVRLRAVQ